MRKCTPTRFLRITPLNGFDAPLDPLRFSMMGAYVDIFRDVARWTVVRTTVSGRGHPEPRKYHRRGSKLARMEVRATLAELAAWKREADGMRLSLSDLVRAKLNGTPVRIVAVADPAHLAEMKRHNSNLNQLLHAMHAGFPVTPAHFEATLDALHALYRREIERG